MEDRQGYKLDRPAKAWTSSSTAQKLRIVFEGDDYLKCNPFKGDGTVDTTREVYAMKPWSMRRTLWDGTGPDNGGVSYVFSTNSARLATMGSVSEQQKITPTYNDGDVIYAETESEVFTLTNGKKTSLVDANDDGRAWAHLGSSGTGGGSLVAPGATVQSVGLLMPNAVFAVSGAPVTNTGTLQVDLLPQITNVFWAGPASGVSAPPQFRAITLGDLPAGIGSVTSVGLAAPGIFTVSGSPVTASGTLTFSLDTQTWGKGWFGPADGGAAAAPAFRVPTLSDIPNPGYRFFHHSASLLGAGSTQTNSLFLVGSLPPTFTNADDAGGAWRKFTSTAGGLKNIVFTASIWPDWLPDVTFRIKTDTTNPSDCIAMGLGDLNFGSATGQFDRANVVGVRYAPIAGVGDTGNTWRVVSNIGGAAATVVNTALAIATSTIYEFRFQYLSTASVNVYYRTGGSGAWTLLANVTSALPAPGGNTAAPFLVVQEAGGTGRGVLFGRITGYLQG